MSVWIFTVLLQCVRWVFSPSIRQPYGVNKGKSINCFTSSMPIRRVNSYGEAFPWLDGRKQSCVFIILVLDCKKCQGLNKGGLWYQRMIHKDISVMDFFVMEAESLTERVSKALRGCLPAGVLIKQKDERQTEGQIQLVPSDKWVCECIFKVMRTVLVWLHVSVCLLFLVHTFALCACIDVKVTLYVLLDVWPGKLISST